MFGGYFYNSTLKRTVAVFGSLFNNISVMKRSSDDHSLHQTRVPIIYGPRSKALERMTETPGEDDTKIAIKLPRMSFEMKGLSYNSEAKRNSLNKLISGAGATAAVIGEGVPYTVSMELNILANSQTEALQILEQIIPTFKPEYTVSVKDMIAIGQVTDVPITLGGISMDDSYEGNFTDGRRAVVYTLDFTMKVIFVGDLSGGTDGSGNSNKPYIKFIDLYFHSTMDRNSTPDEKVNVSLGDPANDTPSDYTVVTTYGFADDDI